MNTEVIRRARPIMPGPSSRISAAAPAPRCRHYWHIFYCLHCGTEAVPAWPGADSDPWQARGVAYRMFC